MAEKICYVCGNLGKPEGCPKCGRDSNRVVIPQKKKEVFIRKCEYNLIEEEYVGLIWDKESLVMTHPELSKDNNFIVFAERINKMHEAYKNGLVPRKSAFICAPAKMGKATLAYSMMQFAIANGVSVAPFLDTIDLKRLLTLGADNPNYKYLGFSYDKYINSTLCIVSVTKLEKFTEALAVINEILSKRSRLGLPTIILSRYNLKDISKDCLDNDYTSLVESSPSANRLKFPVIISYNK